LIPWRNRLGTAFSLVLPTYNPGPQAEKTWRAVSQFVAEQAAGGIAWEILFVLDGCTDETDQRLITLSRGDPRIRVLSYATNRGKGHAVRVGLLAAQGNYRLFTDVDLAYSFEDIGRVADALRSGAEVAIASREHPDSRMLVPPTRLGYTYRRRLQSLMFRTTVRQLLALPHRDTQAGLKGMTAAVAERVIPELTCNGFAFDCEFLTACAKGGIAVTETPVCVRYDESASTTGTVSGLRMLREVWSIRRRWRTRTLPPAPLTATALKAA
jgi:dolichyl-phosphate beta-glucosyltransferase